MPNSATSMRARVEAVQNRHQPPALVVADQVDLVEHDHVAELDLLDQQVDHGAPVLITQRFATRLQAVA